MFRATLAIVSAAAAVTMSGPAFTAGGHAPGDISGYVISDVSYEHGADPTVVTGVHLTLDEHATLVKVRLGSGTEWSTCAPAQATRWRCGLSSPLTVAAIETLEVVASS